MSAVILSSPIARRGGRAGPAAVFVTIALATLAAVAADANRQAAAQGRLEAEYTASIAGIPIGRGNWIVEISDDQYTAAASGTTTGLVRFFTGAHGTGAAHGDVSGGQPVPTSYGATIIYDRTIDDVRMALAGGNVTDYAVRAAAAAGSRPHPGHRCRSPRRLRSDDLDAQSRSPATATRFRRRPAIARSRCSTAACATICTANSSAWKPSRRIAATPGRPSSAPSISRRSPATCRTARRSNIWSTLRDAEVWLAPISGTRVLVPFRFSMPTPLGTGLLQAKRIRLGGAAAASACKDRVIAAGAARRGAAHCPVRSSPLSTGRSPLTRRGIVIARSVNAFGRERDGRKAGFHPIW